MRAYQSTRYIHVYRKAHQSSSVTTSGGKEFRRKFTIHTYSSTSSHQRAWKGWCITEGCWVRNHQIMETCTERRTNIQWVKACIEGVELAREEKALGGLLHQISDNGASSKLPPWPWEHVSQSTLTHPDGYTWFVHIDNTTIVTMARHSSGKSSDETSLKAYYAATQPSLSLLSSASWKWQMLDSSGLSWKSWSISGHKLAQYIQNFHLLQLFPWWV